MTSRFLVKWWLGALLLVAFTLVFALPASADDLGLTTVTITLVDEAGDPLANYPADYPTETRNLKYKYRDGGAWAVETFQTDVNGQVSITIDRSLYPNWDHKITVTLNQTGLEQDVTLNPSSRRPR